ncbi:TPA: hypothetical protein ACVU4C_003694 [Vibrio parahaemolyticus]|nr:hypothetical protein [Vibrio parahaemolyticus]MCR9709943.1 hypothetical protein [Vibrio parahaemolyticus]
MKELKFNNSKKTKKVKREELTKYRVRKRVEEILEDRRIKKEFEL